MEVLSGAASAARQALEGAAVALGTMATVRSLTGPQKQPPLPRATLSREVAEAQPAEAFVLDPIEFLTYLRKARRGAAAGPSGISSATAGKSECDSELLCSVASLLAVQQVPEAILEATRLGRMTALSKPDGGFRVDRRGRHLSQVSGKDYREASL